MVVSFNNQLTDFGKTNANYDPKDVVVEKLNERDLFNSRDNSNENLRADEPKEQAFFILGASASKNKYRETSSKKENAYEIISNENPVKSRRNMNSRSGKKMMDSVEYNDSNVDNFSWQKDKSPQKIYNEKIMPHDDAPYSAYRYSNSRRNNPGSQIDKNGRVMTEQQEEDDLFENFDNANCHLREVHDELIKNVN